MARRTNGPEGPGVGQQRVHRARDRRPGDEFHFGFRLTDPADAPAAREAAEAAGARVLRHGEFAPGSPFLYIEDPDGYTIEIWFE